MKVKMKTPELSTLDPCVESSGGFRFIGRGDPHCSIHFLGTNQRFLRRSQEGVQLQAWQ